MGTTKGPSAWLNSIRTSAFLTKEKTTLNHGQLQRVKTLQTTEEPWQSTRPTRDFQRQRSNVFPDSTSPRTSFSGLVTRSTGALSMADMRTLGTTDTSCVTARAFTGTSLNLGG